MCRVSEAIDLHGEASECLSILIWEGYELKGIFESIIFLYFIALYTNWELGVIKGGIME